MMKKSDYKSYRSFKMAGIVFMMTFISACGGGGSDSSSPAPPPTSGDTTPPPAPVITLADNDNGTLTITGTAEVGSTIRVTFPDNTTRTNTTGQDGNFGPITSTVPQPNGSVSGTATDNAGNTSQASQTQYTDTRPPGTPTQSIVVNDNGTIAISGQAEINSTVVVTFPDETSISATANSQSQYGPIVSVRPQSSGPLQVATTDINGNTSSPGSATYTDTTAPLSPTTNVVVNDDNTVRVDGLAEVDSMITVTFADDSVQTTVSREDGSFGPVTSAMPQSSGEVITTSSDADGNVSEQVRTTYEVNFIPENQLHELVDDAQAKDVVRFLTQATFGPTEYTIQQLIAEDADYATWIDNQFLAYQTRVLAKLTERFSQAGLPTVSRSNLDNAYHKQLLLSDALWETFAYSDDQLRQRVAFALSQMFVVSDVSDTLFNNSRGIAAYHDLIASHAFGNFRDLLQGVTLNPVMGEYLSMIRNEKADQDKNIRPDENYARELMQLFSIGLVMLNDDGTIQLDNEGQPIPTYDQEIIKAFARVFTGWTYANASYWYYDGWLYGDMISPMRAFEDYHDTDEKVLLGGEVLPAGQSALENLEGALDNIFNHQNVAPFISKHLIQHLVTSNPSPDYVSRISAVFEDNGNGTRGDLGAVVKAILLDEEARTGHIDNPETFGKLKQPVLKFTALIRAFDIGGMQPLNEVGRQEFTLRYFWAGAASGQRPYGAPSVFNFFRPDHSPPGPIRDAGLLAPEAQILNEYYITEATNWGSATIFNSYDFLLSGCLQRMNYLDGFGCPYPDFSDEIDLANETSQLLDRLDLLMLAGDMSTNMKDALSVLAEQQTEPRFVVAEVVHLLYHSPQFSVQR